MDTESAGERKEKEMREEENEEEIQKQNKVKKDVCM
jgi:hypothetical protein